MPDRSETSTLGLKDLTSQWWYFKPVDLFYIYVNSQIFFYIKKTVSTSDKCYKSESRKVDKKS